MEKETSSDLERRRFPRLQDNMFVFGTLRSNPCGEFKAFTKDISAEGLMFEAERDIPKESKLELEIYQPTGRCNDMFFSISVLVKVIWVNKIEKDNFEEGENRFRIGVKFLEIEKEDRKRISRYIEEK